MPGGDLEKCENEKQESIEFDIDGCQVIMIRSTEVLTQTEDVGADETQHIRSIPMGCPTNSVNFI